MSDTVDPMADDVGDEVPEADALEQRQDVEAEDDTEPTPPPESMEVPEADAFEQAQDAGEDDERRA